MTQSIMIQGTGSFVGKSTVCAALCRIFAQDGYRVAPFKAQNMSLNSFPTKSGGEIARAQTEQARCAQCEPSTDMNPILLKPTSNNFVQVVVGGKVFGNMSIQEYYELKPELIHIVKECYERLCRGFDIIVIEGAGSPAEINLMEHDITNMRIAHLTSSPVLLVSDMDRGGAFASVVGTFTLLPDQDKGMIKGVIFNRFRGQMEILMPGLTMLEGIIDREVIGVIPYLPDLRFAQEDSQYLDEEVQNQTFSQKAVNVCIIRLPHISNYTDFDPLSQLPDVRVRFCSVPDEIKEADLVIIPGTKNTIEDLAYIKREGFREAILEAKRQGKMIFGICGGYQILGRKIVDLYRVEGSGREAEGLGLLRCITVLNPRKITTQVVVRSHLLPFNVKGEMRCYEIHVGRSHTIGDVRACFEVIKRFSDDKVYGDRPFDGEVSADGHVMGTYLHGLFDNRNFLDGLFGYLRARKGIQVSDSLHRVSQPIQTEVVYERLAKAVRKNLNIERIYELMMDGRGG